MCGERVVAPHFWIVTMPLNATYVVLLLKSSEVYQILDAQQVIHLPFKNRKLYQPSIKSTSFVPRLNPNFHCTPIESQTQRIWKSFEAELKGEKFKGNKKEKVREESNTIPLLSVNQTEHYQISGFLHSPHFVITSLK